MLFAIGFLVTFLFGGLTGVILASPPLDFAVSDSYFVVAHFHYVLFGTVVFCDVRRVLLLVAQVHRQDARQHGWASWHFWTLFIGVHMTFLVQHWLGVEGMPRRIANYPLLPRDVTTLNQISSDRLVGPRRVHAHLPLQRLQDLAVRRAGHRRRPVGLRELAGVGDVLPAAAAQLHLHPAHPVRAPRVRPALPADQVRAGPVESASHAPVSPGMRGETGAQRCGGRREVTHEGRRVAVPRLRRVLRRR